MIKTNLLKKNQHTVKVWSLLLFLTTFRYTCAFLVVFEITDCGALDKQLIIVKCKETRHVNLEKKNVQKKINVKIASL